MDEHVVANAIRRNMQAMIVHVHRIEAVEGIHHVGQPTLTRQRVLEGDIKFVARLCTQRRTDELAIEPTQMNRVFANDMIPVASL